MTEAASGLPYILGTDPLGRDLLSRLIIGARVSLVVGLASVIVSGLIGVTIGLIAGFRRGWLDDVLMRLADIQLGFPGLLLALLVLYLLGSGFLNVIIVLALIRWPVYARVTRSLALELRETTYVKAARAIGCSVPRILVRHILPNLAGPVIVLATLEIALVIILEASLDFLGLGIQPPNSSWGLIVADGRAYLTSAWWVITFSGLCIFLTALSINLVAIWVRRSVDPAEAWRRAPRKRRVWFPSIAIRIFPAREGSHGAR